MKTININKVIREIKAEFIPTSHNGQLKKAIQIIKDNIKEIDIFDKLIKMSYDVSKYPNKPVDKIIKDLMEYSNVI